ncbi:MAG: alpha/beta hydrolase [Bifidobacteriaceae bacterium]|jgi:pimeloyl-ACP methyl ester carboxylesterase|nr:alpha/beta hydrolase [Bifidobacteriaceae bacterium]
MGLKVLPRGSLAGGGTVAPDQPVLVLLHAFPLDHRMWCPVADLLSDLPVCLFDLPGEGLAQGLEPSLDAAAQAITDALTAWGAARWVVGGVSMGGYVAMAMARQNPAGLAGLALIDTKPDPDDAATKQARNLTAREVLAAGSPGPVLGMAEKVLGSTTRASRRDLVDQVRSWIADGDPEAIAWAQAAMASRGDSTQTLRQLRVPASVIVGEQDRLSPPEVAERMAQLIPGADLTVVPNAGHLSPVENPQAIAQALRDLYSRC